MIRTGVRSNSCETDAASLSPAGSFAWSDGPGDCLCVYPGFGLRADGDVGDERRLHECDDSGTTALGQALQGADARLHRINGLRGSDGSARRAAGPGIARGSRSYGILDYDIDPAWQ